MNEELFEEWDKYSVTLDGTCTDENDEFGGNFMRCQCVIGVAIAAVTCIGMIIYNLF